MPLPSRTAVRIYATLYALSMLAIFCANASAAEPTTLALLRPQPISPLTPPTQINCGDVEHQCQHQRQLCMEEMTYIRSRAEFCGRRYSNCMSHHHC
jgi:hypothetical protein